MDKVAEYFDQIASNWDNACQHGEVLDRLISSLAINEDDKVLDVACGTGVISQKLYEKSKTEVDAIDISSEMIKIAKAKNLKGINFINADLYSFRNKKYDIIVIFNAYPHFLELDKFEDALVSLLKPKGKVYIIHDCDREELNSHHKAHAMQVSRMLQDIETEANRFKNHFEILEAYEKPSEIKIELELK